VLRIRKAAVHTAAKWMVRMLRDYQDIRARIVDSVL
jgi:hypothetical protein